jgi:hypothetical protein
MQVNVARTIFHYKELTEEQIAQKGQQNYGHFKYRLERIDTAMHEKRLHNSGIERSTVCGVDLAQLQVFNEVFIPECNADGVRIVFHELDGSRRGYSFSACQLMEASEEAAASSVVYPNQEDDGDAYFATSGNTMVHDYIETQPGRFFHIGISFLPIGPLFMPLWLCAARMERLLLVDWPRTNEVAKKEALVVLRLLNGGHSIRHAISRQAEKNG